MRRATTAAPLRHGARDPDRDKKIREVRYFVNLEHFQVTFHSGHVYTPSRSVLETDDGSEITSVEVGDNEFFFRVVQASGNSYEIPWDRVLYETDQGYRFYKKRASDSRLTPKMIGDRIKKIRTLRGLTQAALADKTGILRPNIARIEAGKHPPSLAVLERVANALEVPLTEIVAVV